MSAPISAVFPCPGGSLLQCLLAFPETLGHFLHLAPEPLLFLLMTGSLPFSFLELRLKGKDPALDMLGVHLLCADLLVENADPALQVPGIHQRLVSLGLFFRNGLVQGRDLFRNLVVFFL